MKSPIIIIFLFCCQCLRGQIKYGTYQQVDNSLEADLKLYPDRKFDFYDTRDESCWLWSHYIGEWKLNKDTITFTWQKTWTENSDTIIARTDLKNHDIIVEFFYDDGKPIVNVKTSFYCLWDDNPKTYLSDVSGKVKISRKVNEDPNKRMCAAYDRMLSFEVRNEVIKLSSNTSIDYYAPPLSNIFKIIIKKKPKTYSKLETKKYLVKKDRLIDIDKKKNYNYNWGNFKFSTAKYGR